MNKLLLLLAISAYVLTYVSSKYVDDEYEDPNQNQNTDGIDANNQQCVDEFRQAILEAHNEYRANCGVSNLRENSQLDDESQNYAAYLAQNNILEHSGANKVGENLHYSIGMADTCAGI